MNHGPSDAQLVTVRDRLPAHTTLVSAAVLGGGRMDDHFAGRGRDGRGAVFQGHGRERRDRDVPDRGADERGDGRRGSGSQHATAASNTSDGTPSNNTAQSETTVRTEADLEIISKVDTPDPVTAGTDLTYTIGFVNHGPSDAQRVAVRDVLPPHTSFVSAAVLVGAGWTIAAPPAGGTGEVVFSQVTIAPLATASFEIVVHVLADTPAGTVVRNTATASSDTNESAPDPHPNSAAAETTVQTEADLELISKLDTPDPVTAGTDLRYTIGFVNHGPSDAQRVAVRDVLPPHTSFVSAAVLVGAGWTIAAPPAGGTGEVVFSQGTVAPLATATFEIVVHVLADTPAGTVVRNTATASSDTNESVPDPHPNSAAAETTVQTEADLELISKLDTPDPVTAGTDLRYTIGFVNHGPSDAQRVAVRDVLPPHATFVSAAVLVGAGWTIAAPPAGGTGEVVFSQGTVAPLATATFEIVVHVLADTPAGTVVRNTATASSDTNEPVPDPHPNSAAAETTVQTEADLELISKLDTPDPVTAGTDLRYTIGFVNHGPSDAQLVAVRDVLPPHATFVSAAVLVGAGWTIAAPPGRRDGRGRVFQGHGCPARDGHL